jgi:hypothetical protein
MPQTPPCVACGEPLEGWEGHSCYKCVQGLAEQRDDLFDEVMKLRYENKILKEGLPIEKAKTGEDFIVTMKSLDGIKSYIAAYQTRGLVRHWITDDGDALYEPKILRVDHLPSQNSQTQEGS